MTDARDPAAAPSLWQAIGKARMLVDVGRNREAEAAYRDALARWPDHVGLRLGLASVLIDVGELGAAHELLSSTATLAIDEPHVFRMLSYVERRLRNVEAARIAAWRALELDPDDAGNHLEAAHVATEGTLTQAGIRDAAMYLDSALELSPLSPEVLLNAAGLYRYLGDDLMARRCVARGLEIDPENRGLLELHGELLGDDPRHGAVWEPNAFGAVDQLRSMTALLAVAPGNPNAMRMVFARAWPRIIGIADASMPALIVIVLTMGVAMGPGAMLEFLDVGAIVAATVVVATAALSWFVLRHAPRGFARRLAFGGPGTAVRVVGSALAAIGVGIGIGALLWVRDAALVRPLLLALMLLSLGGGAASVLWCRRRYDTALDAGVIGSHWNGYFTVLADRRVATRRMLFRFGVLVVIVGAVVPANPFVRWDAAPVLVVVVAAWAAMPVAWSWRLRMIRHGMATAPDALKGVRPRWYGAVMLAVIATGIAISIVAGLAHAPWTPNALDTTGIDEDIPLEREPDPICLDRDLERVECRPGVDAPDRLDPTRAP